jgi:hypothetical protein
MPKLFISFTGTMYALESGRINFDNLATGLFVFGCTRDHAITPGSNSEYVERIVIERADHHKQLVEALLKAETEGRIRWRSLEAGTASFDLVDDLLTSNGYQPLKQEDYGLYCGGEVARRSTQLEVIY